MHNKTLNSVQAFRGIAALFVCSIYCIHPKVGINENLHPFTTQISRICISIGNGGIDLFFIIRGFIITLLVLKTKERSIINAFAFLIKRFFRIYPLFWITLLAAIYGAFLIGYNGIRFQEVQNIKVILLLTNTIPFQEVAWTLAFKVYFYLGVFLFLYVSTKKYFFYFLLCWGGPIFIFLYLFSSNIFNTNYFILQDPRILEFFIGSLLVPILMKKQNHLSDKYICILLGFLLLTISAVSSYNNFPRHLYLGYWEIVYLNGFAAAFLIYGFIGLEFHKKKYIPTFLKKLGDISYSIYLWHFPVISFSTFTSLKISLYQQLPVLCRSLIEIISTIIIAFISYHIIRVTMH